MLGKNKLWGSRGPSPTQTRRERLWHFLRISITISILSIKKAVVCQNTTEQGSSCKWHLGKSTLKVASDFQKPINTICQFFPSPPFENKSYIQTMLPLMQKCHKFDRPPTKALHTGFGWIPKVTNRHTTYPYKFQEEFWSPQKIKWATYQFHRENSVCLIKTNVHMWVRRGTRSSTCSISASPVPSHLSIRLSKQIPSPKMRDEASQKWIVRIDTTGKKNIQHTSL